MRHWHYLPLLCVVLALPLLGSDIDGTWAATIETPRGAQEIRFTFKTDGDTLTGTVGGPRGDSDIQDGKIEGDKISFNQKAAFRDREMMIHYTGTLASGELQMTRQMEGFGEPREFTAKKQ